MEINLFVVMKGEIKQQKVLMICIEVRKIQECTKKCRKKYRNKYVCGFKWGK